MNGFVVRHRVVFLAGCLLLPALALGQTAAGLAGVVRDTSGGGAAGGDGSVRDSHRNHA